jgi:thiopeptide-type bacteriocin biosynthesis protein
LVNKKNISLKNGEIIQVNKTNATEIIRGLSQKPIHVSLLIDNLKKSYPKISTDIFKGFILELIQQDILITEFKILKIANHLTHLRSIGTSRKEVQNLIKSYKTNPNIQTLQSIERSLNSITTANDTIKVEAVPLVNYNSLNRLIIQRDIQPFLDFSTQVATNHANKEFEYLKQFFQAKYGDTLVSFLDFFEDYNSRNHNLNSSTEDKFSIKFKRELSNIIDENLFLQKSSVRLDEYKSRLINDSVDGYKILPYSIGCFPYYRDNELYYEISPVHGGMSVLSLFGRFTGKCANNYKLLKNEYKKSIGNKGFKHVSINYVPSNKKMINIMESYDESDINLNFSCFSTKNTKNTLSIKDIEIGYSDGYLLFFDKNNRSKPLIFSQNSAANYNIFSHPYLSFLLKFSTQTFDNPFAIFSLVNETILNRIYTPEINIGKVTLVLEQWNITNHHIITDSEINIEQMKKIIIDLKKIYHLPDNVYIIEGDQRLFVNTSVDIKLILSIVNHSIRNKTNVKFQVSNVNKDNLICSEANGKNFLCELILNIFPPELKNDLSFSLPSHYYQEPLFTQKQKEWNQIILHPYNDNEQILLTEGILPFFKNTQNRFFFIRYVDAGKKSIRLRVPTCEMNKESLSKWLFVLKEKNILADFSFALYTPEISRYGGKEVFNIIEQYFCDESYALLNILAISTEKSEINKADLAIFIAINIVLGSTNDIYEGFSVLESNYFSSKVAKEYRKKAALYSSFLTANTTAFKPIEKILTGYLKKIQSLNKSLAYVKNKNQVINSLIHMMCNRLLKAAPENELYICQLATFTLKKKINELDFALQKNKNF